MPLYNDPILIAVVAGLVGVVLVLLTREIAAWYFKIDAQHALLREVIAKLEEQNYLLRIQTGQVQPAAPVTVVDPAVEATARPAKILAQPKEAVTPRNAGLDLQTHSNNEIPQAFTLTPPPQGAGRNPFQRPKPPLPHVRRS
jgi:hypothetical protein